MKGFYISIKNDLLEPKHITNMGESVWLYMWLLDKMTSVNENGVGKVNAGRPVTHAIVAVDLGIDERRYQRWIKKLRDSGYIKTLRTPYGLVITVCKAQKIYGKSSDKNVVSKELSESDTTKTSEQIRQKRRPVTTKTSPRPDKNVVANNNKSNTSQIHTTDVVEPAAPVVYGKPEINELFDYWAMSCQFNIETRVANNRRAASNLLKKYGADGVKRLIDGVALTHSDTYAPTIGDFCELQQKLPSLIVWGRKKHGSMGVEVIS